MMKTHSILRTRTFWAIALAYAVVACAANATYRGPAQDWWKERGPVIRHDTFPADCTLCHLEGSWNEIREDFEFNHVAETGHPLEGAHAAAACLRCHNDRGPVALFAERGCSGCHEDPHTGQLGRTCDTCHSQENWRVFDFIAEHNQTRFPLVGAHAAAACWRCHEGAQVGNFALADTDCANCHTEDLAQAVTPDHQAAGWTFGCDRCHVPTTWSGQGFSHAAFPLTGGHAGVADCTTCHVGGVFAGTSPDCYNCHDTEYMATTDPSHAASMFDTNCRACHSTFAWTPATFNHSWPLSGAHAAVDCMQCHGGGVYAGTATDCFACHSVDYNGTMSPPHTASGFGTNCESCHTAIAWTPATFNHSFPTTGDHNLSCADCHTTNMPPAFSCIDCHEHNFREMDDEHDDVPGFIWESNACLNCHPDGMDD
tara:strand:+ start:4704 stop:5984 length:1281 start_codon:yes stop_codon:yes gene_type:complete